jgi:hypothetical protein
VLGSGGGDDDPFHSSDHPNEPDLPGEDNPGERLIEKYDPTIDSGATAEASGEPDFSDLDADDETARLFWYLVVVFNVALMGLAIGPMLILFLDEWLLGGQITAAGAILAAYGYYRYRRHDPGSDDGGGATGHVEPTSDDENG